MSTPLDRSILTQRVVAGQGAFVAQDQLESTTLRHLLYAIAHPVAMPKDKAPWAIYSTLLGTRAAAAHKAHGQFTAVVLDIDRSNPSLGQLRDSLAHYLAGAACVAYTSRSATRNNRKWRVVIPTCRNMTAAERTGATRWLTDMLELQGIAVATESSDPGRIWYLPNHGEFYESDAFGRGYTDPDNPKFRDYILREMQAPAPPATANTKCPPDFAIIADVLEATGAFLGRTQDGWQIVCPWRHEHSNPDDETGAWYATPSPGNNWLGGFKCHHGHCQHRNIAPLRAWAWDLLDKEST